MCKPNPGLSVGPGGNFQGGLQKDHFLIFIALTPFNNVDNIIHLWKQPFSHSGNPRFPLVSFTLSGLLCQSLVKNIIHSYLASISVITLVSFDSKVLSIVKLWQLQSVVANISTVVKNVCTKDSSYCLCESVDWHWLTLHWMGAYLGASISIPCATA